MPWRAAVVVELREVGHDLGRSWHVERTAGIHEVALGINVDEYERAFEHGLPTLHQLCGSLVSESCRGTGRAGATGRIAQLPRERLTRAGKSAYNRGGWSN